MEIRFENNCPMTKELLIELSRNTLRTSYKLYFGIFIPLFFLCGVFGLYRHDGTWSFIGVLALIGCAFLCFLYFTGAKKAAMRAYRRNQELYGNTPLESAVVFQEDFFTQKNLNSGGSVDVEYEKVQKIIETEHLYILLLPESVGVMIAKQGFLTGEAVQFLPFLIAKCPNAKIKIKVAA